MHACVYVHTVTAYSSPVSPQELVAYYQQNSLGSSFPGVDTTLRFPHKEAVVESGGGGVDRNRSRSTSTAPQVPHPHIAPSSAPPIGQGESRAEVMFTFVAEFADELTVEVGGGAVVSFPA